MGRRSRKRSFPHWEKKHRKRTERAFCAAVSGFVDSVVVALGRSEFVAGPDGSHVMKFPGGTITCNERVVDGR